ncbi:hypothetical protein MLIT_13480 [Mycolicibacterium litorale]|uniref:Uncharacterized protein n=1 Tax=Mycolicibacterium litorale TaxID=758802 RepID=A0AAD1IIY5_9MYCO|nr:hypothetical protein MLIT_13480 [Mycolicibacterium litorale]
MINNRTGPLHDEGRAPTDPTSVEAVTTPLSDAESTTDDDAAELYRDWCTSRSSAPQDPRSRLRRRREAALRLPPLESGHRDPLFPRWR